ncbi:MAG: hypothetical protein ACT4P4_12785 [Betaproteobacteria bacterium]
MLHNIVQHEGPPPPHAPAMVRELFAQPLQAQNAARIFDAAVPKALVFGGGAQSRPFDELLRVYVGELAQIQVELRAATGEIDAAPLLSRLREGLPSADALLRIGSAVDPEKLEKASSRFIEATLRFARDLPLATNFPGPMRLDSPIGIVSIGSRGDDRHGPDAALIIDPGGNDVYQRAPVTDARISVIVDLAGNDHYAGADIAIRALSAIVDLAGDDRYEADGPGIAAAIAGASLILDRTGNDRYRGRHFAQGAAAFGFAALVDLDGDDEYSLGAWGQGFGAAGGTGLLWDRAGNDSYSAAGEPDAFGRGAALSGAQGAAFGFRDMLGGGIGILRDDAGNDRYHAEMFAQGLGYYYGVGLLWDRGGDDRYRAVRYAQGAAAHEAVGVLRDEAGDDRYALTFGVGQGMGLDVALGVLVDAAGDDDYRAPLLAQGTATANGIGLLSDREGRNRFEVRDVDASWGQAEDHAGLPTLGLLLARGEFVRSGVKPPAAKEPPCEPVDITELRQGIATLRRDHFDAALAVGRQLRCAIEAAADPAPLWREVSELLERDPATPLGGAIARIPQPPPRVIEILDRHPRCSVRAARLVAAPRADVARAAQESTCYRMQAAGRRVLGIATAERRPGRCSPGDPCPLPPD